MREIGENERKKNIRSSRHARASLDVADSVSILILLMNDTDKEPQVAIMFNNYVT